VVAAAAVACSTEAAGPGSAAVESVVVAPSTATVAVGANLSLSAEARDDDGNIIAGQRMSWASEDASIAEVSASGVVTGLKVGTVLIAASARGKDAFARITVNPTPVASVRLSTTHRSMLVGQTAQLTAEALDASGRVLSGRPISWTTSDASVASVTDDGLVTALSAGGAIVSATSEGRSAVASITVATVPVASIVVSPESADLVAGQTAQLTAQLRDSSGASLTGRAVVWATSQASVATVSSDGVVTAVAPGAATITATSEGRSAMATVNVTPRPVSAVIVSPGQVTIFAGQTVQLSALVTDDRGQVLTGRLISFSSGNPQVATVSAQGVVTGIAPGSTTITAVSEGGTGSATVTVAPDPVAAVQVSPSPTSVFVGNGIQLTATPLNAGGRALTGRTVTWSSATPSLASVSSTGFVTGLAAGNAVIVATVEGKQGSASVTVRSVPVASVTVTPSTASVTVGQTVPLTATPRDASGNPLTGRVIGWSSSDNSIATVSASGVVTGVATGVATITATSEGQSGTAAVTVTPSGPGPVVSITVSPATAAVVIGGSVTLVATARDANGTVVPGTPMTWSSSDGSIATVSSGGTVTGVSLGTATITASSGAVSGSATITVQPVPVARIDVTPANPTISIGATVQLTATLYDAQGNVLSGRPVTWSSSSTSRVTVDSNGLASGIRKGNSIITASSGGVSGSTTVRVQ
jgi:uncharacterized protein YjdB